MNKNFKKLFEERLKAEIVSNVNEKAMEEKLNEITRLYVDRLLEMLKNPDADIGQINEGVRVIGHFRQWGTIQDSTHSVERRPFEEKTFERNLADFNKSAGQRFF